MTLFKVRTMKPDLYQTSKSAYELQYTCKVLKSLIYWSVAYGLMCFFRLSKFSFEPEEVSYYSLVKQSRLYTVESFRAKRSEEAERKNVLAMCTGQICSNPDLWSLRGLQPFPALWPFSQPPLEVQSRRLRRSLRSLLGPIVPVRCMACHRTRCSSIQTPTGHYGHTNNWCSRVDT